MSKAAAELLLIQGAEYMPATWPPEASYRALPQHHASVAELELYEDVRGVPIE